MPSELADAEAKDRYAEMAKLLAVAYRARALVMIVESWVRLPDATGHIDPNIRPSQAADRKEMVALLLEDGSVSATILIPILRDSTGVFADLGLSAPTNFGNSEGRFSKLMPRHKPSSDECAKAKRTLLVMGMNVVNRGFDPNMN